MATIDIKLTQAVEDTLYLPTGAGIDVDTLLNGLVDGMQAFGAFDDVARWRPLPDGVEVSLGNGATVQLTGGSLSVSADGKIHVAVTAIELLQPGVAALRETGNFDFVFAVAGSGVSLVSASLDSKSITLSTLFPPGSSDADPVLGNVTLAVDGAMHVGVDGEFTGQVHRVSLQADAFIRSAYAEGQLDIGDSAAGTIRNAGVEFRDGSYVRVADAALNVDMDALALGKLAGAVLGGDDRINVDLPGKLYESIVIDAGAGNDVVTVAGGGGKLAVQGGAGNDVINVVSGAHALAGGTGFDTVVYAGQRSSYAIGIADRATTVAGPGGTTDTLTGVERVRFADGVLALDADGNAGQAYRLYVSAFDRVPNKVELGYWIGVLDGGASLSNVSRLFVGSQEFATLYGGNVDNRAFVDLLYKNVMHRAADDAGYQYWLGIIDGGADRANVLQVFSESTENRAQVVGAIGHGIDYVPY